MTTNSREGEAIVGARLRKALAFVRTSVRSQRANGFQLAGLAVFTAGCFSLTVWLGLMVAGLCLGVIGWAVDDTQVTDNG